MGGGRNKTNILKWDNVPFTSVLCGEFLQFHPRRPRPQSYDVQEHNNGEDEDYYVHIEGTVTVKD